jgi:hypothetical protein
MVGVGQNMSSRSSWTCIFRDGTKSDISGKATVQATPALSSEARTVTNAAHCEVAELGIKCQDVGTLRTTFHSLFAHNVPSTLHSNSQ